MMRPCLAACSMFSAGSVRRGRVNCRRGCGSASACTGRMSRCRATRTRGAFGCWIRATGSVLRWRTIMQIGAMNHPRHDVVQEMAWMADMGLDFIDLTLEPPAAATWRVDGKRLLTELEARGLSVVGHTAYYLPIGSPFEEVRRGAVAELRRCLEVFAEVGARWMNIHPDGYAPMHDRTFAIERNVRSLRELMESARRVGIGLMI